MKNNFYEDLKKYFEETPREKVLEDWEKSKECDKVGPTVNEYLNKIAEPLSEEDMKRWRERVRYNEFHKVKLENIGFEEHEKDSMYYLKVNEDVEITFVLVDNTVHLYNGITGDYFGLGEVLEYKQLEGLVLILKQIIK